MEAYLELLRRVRHHGVRKSDRTGTGTLSVFGWQSRYDLARGFPALTTKRLHLRSIFHELFFSGGSWLFLYSDTLIRLFPLPFWQDAFLFAGVLDVLGGLVLALALRPKRLS